MHPVNLRRVLIPNNAQAAIDRACQLIEELGAGEVVGGMVDVCSETREPVQQSHLSLRTINKLLGTRPYKRRDARLSSDV